MTKLNQYFVSIISKILFLFIFALLSQSIVFAESPNLSTEDSVYLNSGEIIKGKIIFEGADSIVLQKEGELLTKTYYLNELTSYETAKGKIELENYDTNRFFEIVWEEGGYTIYFSDSPIAQFFHYALFIAGWLILTFPVFIISKKTGVGIPFAAFIPILNFYLLLEISDKPRWWFWAVFLPLIPPFAWNPILQWLAILIYIPVWMGVAEKRKHNIILGVFIVVPVIGQIIEWYIALSDNPKI